MFRELLEQMRQLIRGVNTLASISPSSTAASQARSGRVSQIPPELVFSLRHQGRRAFRPNPSLDPAPPSRRRRHAGDSSATASSSSRGGGSAATREGSFVELSSDYSE
ncbi:uncharacterized protein PV09_09479 [Verruconis gallopava]|uniref:Uncharacterized protein n=1 Tax=Verruconis gallopava TaxID=253628 RepID=A0A0D1ZWB1_9PEZI|nr:uncharacterized protein PV09_09479 [Verruconis gallopava]KIV98782.1 hypothetical protein PV09_09479 [Verruconis gallopava]